MLDENFLEGLPTNPKEAFPLFEYYIREKTIGLDKKPDEIDYSSACQYLEHIIGFAAVSNLQLEFNYTIPTGDSQQFWEYFLRSKSKINTYITSLSVLNARQKNLSRTGGYALTAVLRDEIVKYISEIRKIIIPSNLEKEKKDRLMAKLHNFAKEVDMERTTVQAIGDVYVTAMKYVGEGAKELQPVVEAIERICHAVAKAKELPALPKPKEVPLLEAPKRKLASNTNEDVA